jgi:aspartyl/asparaginyl beta-hydroxylase (cupin superfamily)
MRYVDRSSRLERLPEQRSLWERLDRHTARPELEHLTILHSQRAEKYWIADAETGEIFLRQPFTTLKHCYEAAAELERTFAIAQVLEMRSPETLESLSELVQEHWLRERVAVVLG